MVTDSTASLPAGVGPGIHVVPMTVVMGGRACEEGVDCTPSDAVDAVAAGERVTTAHPSPARLLEHYRAAADAGATAVVSAHLSAQLSGCVNAARLAAERSPIPVRVVDTRTVAMGLGFAALAAARAAESGASLGEAADACNAAASSARVAFVVDDLEYLRRGGRIGSARAVLGNALAIKPILGIVDGEVAPLERVRTMSRALARLEELAVEGAAGSHASIAVHHAGDPRRAHELARLLREAVPQAMVLVSELCAVLGVHAGPGTVAVVVSPDGH